MQISDAAGVPNPGLFESKVYALKRNVTLTLYFLRDQGCANHSAFQESLASWLERNYCMITSRRKSQ